MDHLGPWSAMLIRPDRFFASNKKGGTMQNLKSNPGLLQALQQSVSRAISATERTNQRVSFIMGSLDDKSQVDRKDVEQYVAREMGTLVRAR